MAGGAALRTTSAREREGRGQPQKGEGSSKSNIDACLEPRRQPRRNTRRLIMQLHGTANAQNAYPSAGPRFLRRTIRVALAVGRMAAAGLSLSGTLAASNDDGPRGCVLASLKGRCVFAFSTTL